MMEHFAGKLFVIFTIYYFSHAAQASLEKRRSSWWATGPSVRSNTYPCLCDGALLVQHGATARESILILSVSSATQALQVGCAIIAHLRVNDARMNRHIHQIRRKNKEGGRNRGRLDPSIPCEEGDRHPSVLEEISLLGTTL